jgi:Tfp pilus assembly protein PilX
MQHPMRPPPYPVRDRNAAPAGATRRDGMALPVAIFAIVVIGALLAGAFFASAQESKIGGNTLVEQRSFNVAEFGLNYDVSTWPRERNIESRFPVGTTQDNIHYYNNNNDVANVSVTRLTDKTFLVVSAGQANAPNAATMGVRRTSMLVQIAYPDIRTKGAIVSGGLVDLNGSGAISGYDQDPPNQAGDCSSYSGGRNMPAVVVPPPTLKPNGTIQTSYFEKGNGGDSTTAMPPSGDGAAKGVYGPADSIVRTDPSATDTAVYRVYGSENWKTLKASALQLPSTMTSLSPAPSLIDTRCNTGDFANWGQIDHVNTTASPNAYAPCIGYYPIIYAPGNLRVTSGSGQGILLVENDLTLAGNFTFNGLIIVGGQFEKGNGNVNISGGVMVQNLRIGTCNGNVVGGICTSTSVSVSGNFAVRYSQCSIENALRGSAILVPVKQRAWAQLY